jgi:L-alanine-DL-glutamate epimerase-like enolase superfamily enzyme
VRHRALGPHGQGDRTARASPPRRSLPHRIPCYVSGLPADSDASRAELARTWRENGYGAIKLALGFGASADDATFGAVRSAVGDDIELYVDAHWRYTVPQAIALGRRLEALGLGFLEAPTIPEDLHGQAEIARALDVAVAGGEGLRTRYEFRDRFVQRSFDIAQQGLREDGLRLNRHVGAPGG